MDSPHDRASTKGIEETDEVTPSSKLHEPIPVVPSQSIGPGVDGSCEELARNVTESPHQRPELPNPWLPLAPLVSSVDSLTGPVSTGVGTNCAILSPDRIS